MVDDDFGFLSDTDESAVEELISQAQDLSVLEQVSKINCTPYDDSLLPSHLESRFQKLKSFPPLNPHRHHHHKSLSGSTSLNSTTTSTKRDKQNPDQVKVPSDAKHIPPVEDKEDAKEEEEEDEEEMIFSPLQQNHPSIGKKGSGVKSKHGSSSSSGGSFDSWLRHVVSSSSPPKKDSATNFSSMDEYDSPSSPPKKPGCSFWCSPKKSRKANKKDDAAFWVKEHQKMLREAFKEEQKINKEAEKIIKWARQASARISFHGASDNDDDDDDVLHRIAK